MSLRTRLAQQLGLKARDENERAAAVVAAAHASPSDQAPQGDVAAILPVAEEEQIATGEQFLSPHELRYRSLLLEQLYKMMDLSRVGDLPEDQARQQIHTLSHQVMSQADMPLSAESRNKITQQVEFEILGLGPLELLLRDPSVSDIMVNGPKCVYVERAGRLQRSPVVFDDNQHLMRVIDRIVSRVGRRIDESVPLVDARLEDGSRVNVIIPPLAIDGPTMSIRRFPASPLTLANLVEKNALSMTMARLLAAAVKGRKNILISGGTGSGKTTALNALSAFIPNSERIITIEDAAELQLQQSHVVRLETRPANIEGRGHISQRDLVKNSLRMRPDRIILGEVRSEEALDMLQAMNTGHDGSLATVHANTPRDALSRVENMVAMAGFDLPARAVRNQIASAVDMVVQVARLDDGTRRMVSISEIVGMEGEVITMSEIFAYERVGVSAEGNVVGRFKATGAVPTFLDELRRRGLDVSLDMFDIAQGD
jgi:pilus assembly protein CpaF